MREIKFRAWDKAKKRFITEVGIECAVNHGFESETSAFIFEQFTGLHDKNGREIYEGDVIKYDAIDCFASCVIKWDGFQFNLFDLEYKTFEQDIRELERSDYIDCEIIGNIHENPELLEASK